MIPTLTAGAVSVDHDTVVPVQGCIMWCSAGQWCSPNATGVELSSADGNVIVVWAWPPIIEVGIAEIGVTECISSTPSTVDTISNTVAEAAPR